MLFEPSVLLFSVIELVGLYAIFFPFKCAALLGGLYLAMFRGVLLILHTRLSPECAWGPCGMLLGMESGLTVCKASAYLL